MKGNSKNMKKLDYLKWDEYFMGISLLSSLRSKDPSTSVGACIVSPNNKILSLGYNGMPIGCSDDEYPWEREGDPLKTKYLYVCHAELNAILNYSGTDMKRAKIYTTLFPCNECTKAIIQSGIKEVIYMHDKYANSDSVQAAKKMMKSANVRYRQYELINKDITLSL
jgi:dCMP deaminase